MTTALTQERFFALADVATKAVVGEESVWLSLRGEDTDFVRFNRGRIRQPGHVRQDHLTLRLVDGARHVLLTLTLSGQATEDEDRLKHGIARLREKLPHVRDDPHLLLPALPPEADTVPPSRPAEGPGLPPSTDVAGAIVDAARGEGAALDLVGILAMGPVRAGFASSRGHRRWFSRPSLNFDFSLFAGEDKAAKSGYAGFAFDADALRQKIHDAKTELDVLRLPPVHVDPGSYRAWLAPAAVYEIVDLLGWGGFSTRALQTKQSPLLRLFKGEVRLDPRVRLVEESKSGAGPLFSSAGFPKPGATVLVDDGRLLNTLTSPRSEREYGVKNTGADLDEGWSALSMAPGTLDESAAYAHVGTGIFVSHLWYLNYSDTPACRMTGMTRFQTLFIEDGKPKGPLSVMRFDDSFFRLFGEKLEGIGRSPELILDAGSYEHRSTRSARLPGVLVDGLTLTL